VLGALTLQGEIVPVLDLRPRLGFEPRPPPEASPLVIVKCRGRQLAVLVDYVDGVEHADQPLTAGGGWDCMRGLVMVGGQVVAVLDADKLPSAGIEALLPSSSETHSRDTEPFLG
jgi:chemotaxis signal transduction protein